MSDNWYDYEWEAQLAAAAEQAAKDAANPDNNKDKASGTTSSETPEVNTSKAPKKSTHSRPVIAKPTPVDSITTQEAQEKARDARETARLRFLIADGTQPIPVSITYNGSFSLQEIVSKIEEDLIFIEGFLQRQERLISEMDTEKSNKLKNLLLLVLNILKAKTLTAKRTFVEKEALVQENGNLYKALSTELAGLASIVSFFRRYLSGGLRSYSEMGRLTLSGQTFISKGKDNLAGFDFQVVVRHSEGERQSLRISVLSPESTSQFQLESFSLRFDSDFLEGQRILSVDATGIMLSSVSPLQGNRYTGEIDKAFTETLRSSGIQRVKGHHFPCPEITPQEVEEFIGYLVALFNKQF